MNDEQKEAYRNFCQQFRLSLPTLCIAVTLADDNPNSEEYGTRATEEISNLRVILNPKDIQWRDT